MTKSKNIIVLYAELTPYIIGCLDYLILKNLSIKLYVVYNNIFENLKIEEKSQCKFFSNKEFKSKNELLKFCNNLKPSILLVSGRMYKEYLYVSKRMKNKSIRVTVQDTLYNDSFKQFIIRKLTGFLYLQYFDKFWGIGEPQRKFAKYIGFKEKDILKGFYVADKKFFFNSKVFSYRNNALNILFIGRLVKEKNILRLIDVIEKINNNTNSKHKIIIIGNGYLVNRIKKSNVVKYIGLKSQEKIIEIALECDVFCLPSTYEPWGVVTHEMSALGLPIIASELCGSSYDLVKEGYNGFKFNPYSKPSMQMAFEKFISLSLNEKKELSSNSIKISKKITHENWNKSILSILD